jgi:hypothetical protein
MPRIWRVFKVVMGWEKPLTLEKGKKTVAKNVGGVLV